MGRGAHPLLGARERQGSPQRQLAPDSAGQRGLAVVQSGTRLVRDK